MTLRIEAMLNRMTRQVFIVTALAVAVFLLWLGWNGWFYIQQGYSLRVGLAGEPGSVSHIDFPRWRAAVHVLLFVAAMVSIVAYIAGRKWTPTAAWLTFGATMVISIVDVGEYGFIGSPTSIWTVLLLLLLAVLTRFGPLPPRAEA